MARRNLDNRSKKSKIIGKRDGNFRKLLALLALIAAGGIFAMSIPPFSPVLAQSSGQAPEFDVVSVRPSTDKDPLLGMYSYAGGRIVCQRCTLVMLINSTYGTPLTEISGGPKWATVDRYTIVAEPPPNSSSSKIKPKSPNTPPPPEELLMLQSLLAKRFHLVVHKELTEKSGFTLRLEHRSAKLVAAADKTEWPLVAFGTTHIPETPFYLQGENASMSLLAARLESLLKVPVVDETGLDGTFDFKFDFADDPEETGPQLSTGLRDLGLALASKKVPITLLMIDTAERPTPN
jgi:uncharacterized protein (TIGR03435 family)